MDIDNIDPIVAEALDLVFSSTRPMPAHFTSNGDRTQSFCIDFEPLNATADHELASEAWFSQDRFITEKSKLTEDEGRLALLCGEDLMLGAFIITKLGKPELSNEVRGWIIQGAVERLHTQSRDIEKFFQNKDVIAHLDHCEKSGREIAQTY